MPDCTGEKMRKKVGVDTLRRENGETKENHIDPPQTALDIKNADNNSTGEEEAAAPLNGNHGADSDENSDEGEVGDAAVENQPEDQ